MSENKAPYIANPEMYQLAKMQSQYIYNSEKHLYDIQKFKCVPWQSQACHDYDTYGKCAWSTGSGVGKTALLARLMLHFLHTHPESIVPCTAPTQRQLYNVLWAEASRALHSSPILRSILEWQQERIYVKGHKDTWFAVAIVSTPPKPGAMTTESLQGYHAPNILFVIDECSGIADQILGAADGAMSTPGARALMASNPTRNTGYFHRATHDPILTKEVWRVLFVNAEEINAPYVDKTYIRRLKLIYGEDSDYFRMRVKGLAPRTEASALISPEQIYEAHSRELPMSGERYGSCDPARYGDDDSVFYIRDGNVIIDRVAVHGMNTMEVSNVGLRFIEDHNLKEMRIDVIGIGSGVVDRMEEVLRERKHIIVPVHVGMDANNKEEYFNLRTEIAWQMRSTIDKLSIPIETPNLDEELAALRYGWDNRDKRIKLEAKDETKKRLNPSRSPNDADSLILCCCDLKTGTGIVTPDYFKIGQTNPYKHDTLEGLIAQLMSEGKSIRAGLNLELFLKNSGRKSKNLGSNRYNEFKEDFTSLGDDIFSNTVH